MDSVLQMVDAGITVGSGLLMLMFFYKVGVSIYSHELYVDAATFRKPAAVADADGQNGADDVEMASGAGPDLAEDRERDKLGEVQAGPSGPSDDGQGGASDKEPKGDASEDGNGEKWADTAPSA